MRLTLLLAATLILGACGGDDTRVCFGSSRFCEDAFGRNQPPEASAGRGQEVLPGDRVELDGTDSFDPDGRIASYSWTQRAGEAVALVDASEPVATFTAPEVEETIMLEFRLVVTDDDDASDADHVRVTVVPAAAAALAAGIDLLKTVLTPAASPAPDCADCWSYLGLWLTVRMQAAASGAEGDLDTLLDEVRVIEQLLAGQAPAAGLPVAHRRLFELGQHRVARFLERRDPAVAELAERHLANPLEIQRIRMRDLTDAYPHLAGLTQSESPRLHAVRLLLKPKPVSPSGADAVGLAQAGLARDRAHSDVGPEVLAAATLLLALPELPDAR